jgi:hypothetical protein
MSDPNFQQFFPCVASSMTWEEWNGNFIIYYGQETLPDLPEIQWREAADQIAELPTFSVFPIPGSATFETWQDWADDVTTIINGPSR